MTPTIIALDISTKMTGFAVAVVTANPVPDLGTDAVSYPVHCGRKSFAGGAMADPETHGALYFHWLRDMIAVHNPSTVIWEAPLVRKTPREGGAMSTSLAVTEMQIGLAFMTGVVCRLQQVRYKWKVHVGSVKKHAGHGAYSKDEMLTRARQHWPGVEIPDHNVADALWLLDFGLHRIGDWRSKGKWHGDS